MISLTIWTVEQRISITWTSPGRASPDRSLIWVLTLDTTGFISIYMGSLCLILAYSHSVIHLLLTKKHLQTYLNSTLSTLHFFILWFFWFQMPGSISNGIPVTPVAPTFSHGFNSDDLAGVPTASSSDGHHPDAVLPVPAQVGDAIEEHVRCCLKFTAHLENKGRRNS